MSKGLYDKYTVIKNDGSYTEAIGDYFVLRLDSDVHARKAALAYAESVKGENPHLALDLHQRIAQYEGGLINDKSRS